MSKPDPAARITPRIIEMPMKELTRMIEDDRRQEHRFTLVRAPGGVHAWLCRLGLHAWELRAASITGVTSHRHRRCAVCRKWETR